MQSILTKNQKKSFTKTFTEDGESKRITCNIRYDDTCGNGHNIFAITGEIKGKHGFESGGCIHEEIEKHFPEFKHLIKYHLMSSKGPMHYIANTLYHAKNRTHENKQIGEPVRFTEKLKFKDIPFTFKEFKKGFWAYLAEVGDFNNIEVEPIKYDETDDYKFSEHYSLTGFIKDNDVKKWYLAPFDNKNDAEEFLEALRTKDFEIINIPTDFCKAVKPNFDAARSSGVWLDATDEDLSVEPEELKKKLLERLPKLIEEFKKDIELLGFVY